MRYEDDINPARRIKINNMLRGAAQSLKEQQFCSLHVYDQLIIISYILVYITSTWLEQWAYVLCILYIRLRCTIHGMQPLFVHFSIHVRVLCFVLLPDCLRKTDTFCLKFAYLISHSLINVQCKHALWTHHSNLVGICTRILYRYFTHALIS